MSISAGNKNRLPIWGIVVAIAGALVILSIATYGLLVNMVFL